MSKQTQYMNLESVRRLTTTKKRKDLMFAKMFQRLPFWIRKEIMKETEIGKKIEDDMFNRISEIYYLSDAVRDIIIDAEYIKNSGDKLE